MTKRERNGFADDARSAVAIALALAAFIGGIFGVVLTVALLRWLA